MSHGSIAGKLDSMVISELKQKYFHLQIGISSTNNITQIVSVASGTDITTILL